MENRILNQSQAAEFLLDFVGRYISHVWRGAGTSIFIELGELTQEERKNHTGEFSFSIEWSWRIESRNTIILGSFSEDEEISNTIDILKGKKLIKADFLVGLKKFNLNLKVIFGFLVLQQKKGTLSGLHAIIKKNCYTFVKEDT